MFIIQIVWAIKGAPQHKNNFTRPLLNSSRTPWLYLLIVAPYCCIVQYCVEAYSVMKCVYISVYAVRGLICRGFTCYQCCIQIYPGNLPCWGLEDRVMVIALYVFRERWWCLYLLLVVTCSVIGITLQGPVLILSWYVCWLSCIRIISCCCIKARWNCLFFHIHYKKVFISAICNKICACFVDNLKWWKCYRSWFQNVQWLMCRYPHLSKIKLVTLLEGGKCSK